MTLKAPPAILRDIVDAITRARNVTLYKETLHADS